MINVLRSGRGWLGFERGEDKEVKRSAGAFSSKAIWGSGQARALSALSSEAPELDMEAVRKSHSSKIDVGEIYSPPRVVTAAEAA